MQSMNGEAKILAQLALWKVLLVVLLITGAWMLLKWMRRSFDRLEKHNLRLRFVLRQIEPPLRIMVWFTALLISAEIVAPSKEAFFAAIGSAALAIGLGLQDLIKNLVGGLIIVADRPYQTGDLIKVADVDGEVVQIGLRSTKILTAKGALVTVPNAVVVTSLISNANAGVADCLVSTEMVLPHHMDPDQAIRIGREVAISCPYTHLKRPISLEFSEKTWGTHLGLGEKSAGTHSEHGEKSSGARPLLLNIKAYVHDHRYELAMRTDILRRARYEFINATLGDSGAIGETRDNVIDFVHPRAESQLSDSRESS